MSYTSATQRPTSEPVADKNQDQTATSTMASDGDGGSAFGCMKDPEALEQIGSLCGICGGYPICCHKGSPKHPAMDGMLDAAFVSGTYQNPGCSCCSMTVRGVSCVGFLCMCQKCFGCPFLCFPAPFNPIAFGEGPPIDACHLPIGRNCLPKKCALGATWFCTPCLIGPLPGTCCFDFHDPNPAGGSPGSELVMLTSFCCLFPMVHRKIDDEPGELCDFLASCTDKHKTRPHHYLCCANGE